MIIPQREVELIEDEIYQRIYKALEILGKEDYAAIGEQSYVIMAGITLLRNIDRKVCETEIEKARHEGEEAEFGRIRDHFASIPDSTAMIDGSPKRFVSNEFEKLRLSNLVV